MIVIVFNLFVFHFTYLVKNLGNAAKYYKQASQKYKLWGF